MVSAASMAILDKSEDFSMNTLLLADNQTPSNVDTHSVTAGHIKEQLSSVDDPLPKMRKPYTITKQRERWTEEEHKKFLEALKLYGRAWRQIEEHVGSKTAVQIRSHAQKFFSKVVRESSGSNASSVEPIEIPPPRPKRKPMHPYPRKLVDPLKKGVSVPELPVSSPFPNLSNSEQENQSPTSVLSVVGSDTIGSAGSNSSTGSMSPVSSAAVADLDRFFLSEPRNSPVEQNGSPSPAPEAATAVQDDQVPEIFEDAVAKEGFTVEESTRCLKLFGRTLLVTDPDRPSSSVIGSLEPSPSDMNEGKHLQESSLNADYMWNHSPNGMPGAVYYMRFQNENSNPKEAAFVPPLPWMTCYGGIPFPLVPFPTSDSMKSYPDSSVGADQVKEFQKEGSRTGSNNDLVSEEGNEKNDLGAIEQHRMNKPEMKGFVPYKRCLAERDAQSSTFSGGEKEERRTRLCL